MNAAIYVRPNINCLKYVGNRRCHCLIPYSFSLKTTDSSENLLQCVYNVIIMIECVISWENNVRIGSMFFLS